LTETANGNDLRLLLERLASCRGPEADDPAIPAFVDASI
jgi:hypothetical protein